VQADRFRMLAAEVNGMTPLEQGGIEPRDSDPYCLQFS